MDDYLKDLEKLTVNRYRQVIIASKYARAINARMEKERLEDQSEEGAEKKEAPPAATVATQALKALLDGKIEYEETEKDRR